MPWPKEGYTFIEWWREACHDTEVRTAGKLYILISRKRLRCVDTGRGRGRFISVTRPARVGKF